MVLGIEQRSAACKASALISVLSLWPDTIILKQTEICGLQKMLLIRWSNEYKMHSGKHSKVIKECMQVLMKSKNLFLDLSFTLFLYSGEGAPWQCSRDPQPLIEKESVMLRCSSSAVLKTTKATLDKASGGLHQQWRGHHEVVGEGYFGFGKKPGVPLYALMPLACVWGGAHPAELRDHF